MGGHEVNASGIWYKLGLVISRNAPKFVAVGYSLGLLLFLSLFAFASVESDPLELNFDKSGEHYKWHKYSRAHSAPGDPGFDIAMYVGGGEDGAIEGTLSDRNALMAFMKYTSTTILETEDYIVDKSGKEHPYLPMDHYIKLKMYVTADVTLYQHVYPGACWVEGEVDYQPGVNAGITFMSGFFNAIPGKPEDTEFWVTPYNFCYFARALPMVEIFIFGSVAPSMLPLPYYPEWFFGDCKNFLEPTPVGQYAVLDGLNKFLKFSVYNYALTGSAYLPTYNADYAATPWCFASAYAYAEYTADSTVMTECGRHIHFLADENADAIVASSYLFLTNNVKELVYGWSEADGAFNLPVESDFMVRLRPWLWSCTAVPTWNAGNMPIMSHGCLGGNCDYPQWEDEVKSMISMYVNYGLGTIQEGLLSKEIDVDKAEIYKAITRFKKTWLKDAGGYTEYYTNADGKKQRIRVGTFCFDVFLWITTEAVKGAFGLYAAGLLLLVCYAALAFHSSPLKKARYNLGIVGVLTVALGIGAGLGLACAFGVQFNGKSIQVLPLFLLGLGVDDMFIVGASFHAFDKNAKDHHEITANCISQVGPSVTLTSFTNLVAFGLGVFLPSPANVAFAQMAAIAEIGIWSHVLFCFTAVCSLDAQKRRTKNPELINEDFTTEEAVPKVAVAYGKIVTSWPGRVVILGVFLGFFIFIYENGLMKLKIGLNPKDLFPAGHPSIFAFSVYYDFFGYQSTSTFTTNKFDLRRKFVLVERKSYADANDATASSTAQCQNSVNSNACPVDPGNDGFHKNYPPTGVDLGIRMTFPSDIEIPCKKAYNAWAECVANEYAYRPDPTIIDAEGFNEDYTKLATDDLCNSDRSKAIATCKKFPIGYPAAYADAVGIEHTGQPEAFYKLFPSMMPSFRNKHDEGAPAKDWIVPYDGYTISGAGETWAHKLLMWANPCWYGLFEAFGDQIGEGGVSSPTSVADVEALCTDLFGPGMYNSACADGQYGEPASDTTGRCGPSYGFTYGRDELAKFECCKETEIGEEGSGFFVSNCATCLTGSDDLAATYPTYDSETELWTNLQDNDNYRMTNNEASGSMEMLWEYVFEPLGMEPTWGPYGEGTQLLSVSDSRLDAKVPEEITTTDSDGNAVTTTVYHSGVFSAFTPLDAAFMPDGNEWSKEGTIDRDILGQTLFGESTGNECPTHADGSRYPCRSKSGFNSLLSICSALPMEYMTCKAKNGKGWRGTGLEPCWKGQEWVDIFNANLNTIHPEHFDECFSRWVDANDRDFLCHCTKQDEIDGNLKPEECFQGDKFSGNPTGLMAACSSLPEGPTSRKLILPVRKTSHEYFDVKMGDTWKVVDRLKQYLEINDSYKETYGVTSYHGGMQDEYRYFNIWNVVLNSVALSAIVVYVIMSAVFVGVQPEAVPLGVRIGTAVWTATILLACLLLITYALVGLMGFGEVRFNDIPSTTLIVSIGVGVEFTAHMCFVFLQSRGSAVERTRAAVNHMFKPMFDGAFSTFLGIFPLYFSPFVFVQVYYFNMYFYMCIGGLSVGLVLLPVLLGLIGLPTPPAAQKVAPAA